MAQITVPMHCPEDAMPWIQAHNVKIVDDSKAPYEVTFEAPMDVLEDMLREGWADNGCPHDEWMGAYVDKMTGLTMRESQTLADIVKTRIRKFTGRPSLQVYVDVENMEFIWYDDAETQWCKNSYEWFQILDEGNPFYMQWSFKTGPMPTQYFL